jgi:hypothetical protein
VTTLRGMKVGVGFYILGSSTGAPVSDDERFPRFTAFFGGAGIKFYRNWTDYLCRLRSAASIECYFFGYPSARCDKRGEVGAVFNLYFLSFLSGYFFVSNIFTSFCYLLPVLLIVSISERVGSS